MNRIAASVVLLFAVSSLSAQQPKNLKVLTPLSPTQLQREMNVIRVRRRRRAAAVRGQVLVSRSVDRLDAEVQRDSSRSGGGHGGVQEALADCGSLLPPWSAQACLRVTRRRQAAALQG